MNTPNQTSSRSADQPSPVGPGGMGIPNAVREQLRTLDGKELLVYIHVPFCSSKCTFCDWVAGYTTQQLRGGSELRGRYADAVVRQIETFAPQLMEAGYSPTCIYWGGGTPSRLDDDHLQRIGEQLHRSFDLGKVAEHTVETSPETLTPGKVRTLKAIGVSRISMGVQSFNDDELRTAGRSHSAEQAEATAYMLRQQGFDNFNLDLIVAFPGQTPAALERTIRRTLEIRPPHLTLYPFRADTATVMGSNVQLGRKSLVGVKDVRAMYESSRDALCGAGYIEYMAGYFCTDEGKRFVGEDYYFAMRGDFVGFGSGGRSVLGHHQLVNRAGALESFIEEPLRFDSCERFSPENIQIVVPFLGQALMTDTGVDYARFARIFGFEFGAIRNHPMVAALLNHYRWCGAKLEETEERLVAAAETRNIASLTAISRLNEVHMISADKLSSARRKAGPTTRV